MGPEFQAAGIIASSSKYTNGYVVKKLVR